VSGTSGRAEPHNGTVIDTRLVGYWSDRDLYLGSPEDSDIAFRPNGSGWAYWSKWGGVFMVLRFAWHTTADARLVLRLRRELSGSWYLEDSRIKHRVEDQQSGQGNLAVAYEISQQTDAYGRSARAVKFSQQISPSVIGDRFAYIRTITDSEDDQAGPSEP